MNDLYIHNLETENKQLRIALQECRKALEEEIATKKKAIKYIKKYCEDYVIEDSPDAMCLFYSNDGSYKPEAKKELLEILGGTNENNNI